MAPFSRRDFLHRAGALGLFGLGWAAGLRSRPARADQGPTRAGYGPLVQDPGRLIDLPSGFRYTAFSATGLTMDDGLLVPGAHDGMAAFAGPEGRTILVRNHELFLGADGAYGRRSELASKIDRALLYDASERLGPALGGTTTLVFDTERQVLERHFLSLGGTLRNCAGGATPWGTWITCEETTQRAEGGFARDHGYCFEVPADATPRLHPAVPLTGLGRFNHEAAAVDPRTSAVYLTEDRGDGLLYRFLPERPRDLRGPGRLQALCLADRPGVETGNRGRGPTIPTGTPLGVRWVDLSDTDSPRDDLRHQGRGKGAAVFSRGEGAIWGGDALFFTCTDGGKGRRGQIWCYRPDPAEDPGRPDAPAGQLELLFEPDDPDVFDMVDNLTVAPWGDLILCEDGPGDSFVVGVTPEGETYKLVRNHLGSEWAGVTFSPDGTTMFVNVQRPGFTIAVTGPWHAATARREDGGRRYF